MSRDKVRKLLGFFASPRFLQDWKAAETNTTVAATATWEDFVTKMKTYNKPTENRIIRNFEFRQLSQGRNETFSAFCNRVEETGKNCYFCECTGTACSATKYAVRDQIVIGTTNDNIREKAMLKDWNLADLRTKGMKCESAAAGEENISGKAVNKLGAYSFKTLQTNRRDTAGSKKSDQKCYRCGQEFYQGHMKKCKALNAKCSNCLIIGHFDKICQKKDTKTINTVKRDEDEDEYETETYQLNIWRIKSPQSSPRFSANPHDFKCRLLINNRYAKILVDTGAKVSVCGMKQAKIWGLLDKMTPSTTKIHPYNSDPIQIRGTAICAVTFKERSVPVEFHVLPGSCEPILAGTKSLQLKIVSFDGTDDTYNPVLMINEAASSKEKSRFFNDINHILAKYPQNFKGLGKLKDYQVKLFTDSSIKPVAVPPRVIPYHLRARVYDSIKEMIRDGAIEEHPVNEPVEWVSCAVIIPKSDGT